MFGMALALLLFTEVKQQDLTFEQSKYMGWISCYLFALAWIFMLRSLNYMVSKESKISKKGMLPIKSPAKKEKVKQLKKNLPIQLPPIDAHIKPVEEDKDLEIINIDEGASKLKV